MSAIQFEEKNELRSETIAAAIENIRHNNYLLPEIQRYFTWTHEQVEKLFDSLMRDYITNTFIFWQITSPEIKKTYDFYEFLNHYQKYWGDCNPSHTIQLMDKDFIAVIDGQQRLTALNLGLRGTYAFRPKGATELIYLKQPPRKLYLNLAATKSLEDSQNDNFQEYEEDRKLYDFRFLTKKEIIEKTVKGLWFEVPEIMNLGDNDDKTIRKYLLNKELIDETNEKQAIQTIQKLWHKIHQANLIHYYLVQNQNVSSVLGMFIRTNNGGTSLSYSDLFMSFAFAKWKNFTTDKVREEVETLIEDVRTGSDFIIDKNFIWKACLMLTDNNIRINLDNLSSKINDLSENWEQIRDTIIAGFVLINKLGYTEATFGAKNTALPILYYIYQLNLSEKVKDPRFYAGAGKQNIEKWLRLTLIKSILVSYADTSLTKMRTIISEEIQNGATEFPTKRLIGEVYAGNRDYAFTETEIVNLLRSQYKTPQALAILQFLYPGLDYSCSIHEDHMHPQSIFGGRLTQARREQIQIETQIPESDIDFATMPRHWNSVLNLQLLTDIENREKTNKSLKEWSTAHPERNLFIENGTSLEISDFRTFIESRQRVLLTELKKILLP